MSDPASSADSAARPAVVATGRPIGVSRLRRRRRAGFALVLVGGLLGLLVAATAWIGAAAEEAHPPVGSFVDVGGRSIHVVDRGEGRPVVLLHGAFGGLDDWRATVLDDLASRHRVIALDRPGHAWSERGGPAETCSTPVEQARVIWDVLHHLDVSDPVLVGFSWSGPVVLSMALEHPGEVAACVTINGATHPWPGPLDLDVRAPAWPVVGYAFTELLAAPLGLLFASGGIEKAFEPQPVPAHYERSPIALSLRPEAYRVEAADLRALRPCVRELAPHYAEIITPLVVVVGEGDQIAGPRIHSYPLAAAVPGAELVSVPDGGHQLPYTHPVDVIRAIERAIARAAQ